MGCEVTIGDDEGRPVLEREVQEEITERWVWLATSGGLVLVNKMRFALVRQPHIQCLSFLRSRRKVLTNLVSVIPGQLEIGDGESQ